MNLITFEYFLALPIFVVPCRSKTILWTWRWTMNEWKQNSFYCNLRNCNIKLVEVCTSFKWWKKHLGSTVAHYNNRWYMINTLAVSNWRCFIIIRKYIIVNEQRRVMLQHQQQQRYEWTPPPLVTSCNKLHLVTLYQNEIWASHESCI